MSREVMQQALEALEWFVKNDDTVIGMQGNEFWEAGLNRGIDTVAVLRKELDHIPGAGKMVGPERQPLITDEYVQALGPLLSQIVCSSGTLRCIVRTIEAKHGIKEQP